MTPDPPSPTRRRFRFGGILLVAGWVGVAGVVVLFAAGWLGGSTDTVGYQPHDPPHPLPFEHVVTSVVPDPRPPLVLNPAEPWRIELGRGSGQYGLETVKLTHDGRAVVHQMNQRREWNGVTRFWETATLTLPPEAVTRITDAVAAERLGELHRHYSSGWVDGNQWVLWVRQGNREKAVYFDNHFPEPVVRFAAAVDAELVTAGVGLRWRKVPAWDADTHDRELWASIRR